MDWMHLNIKSFDNLINLIVFEIKMNAGMCFSKAFKDIVISLLDGWYQYLKHPLHIAPIYLIVFAQHESANILIVFGMPAYEQPGNKLW